MEELFNQILETLRRGQGCVSATVVASRGSSPRHVGAKMLVFCDGRISGTIGGGALEKLVTADALALLRKKTSALKTYDLDRKQGLQVCGGSVSIFFEVSAPRRALVICGAGHIGLALSWIAKILDFRVTVIDNRRDFAHKRRFPHVDEVICGAYGRVLKKLKADRNTFIVIVTHGHAHDQECLEASLRREAGYVGMIGSRTKIKLVFEDLMKKGFSARQLKQVHTPVGLDIGAESPQEIAVAIAGQLIQVRNRQNRGGSHVS